MTLRDRLGDALARGRGILLLSDFDGTLTPIVARPGAARLPRRTRRLLARLARHPRVRVGIISGRSLADLRRRVPVPGAVYVGCHGLEIAWRGTRFSHRRAAALAPLLGRVAKELGRRTARIPGVLVEPKGLTVSLHYRLARPHAVPGLRRIVREILARAAPLELLTGKKVLELRPRVGWGKGDAVRLLHRLLRESLGGRPPLTVYLGDDETDEEAFRALHVPGAIAVAVGRRRTRAAYRLPGPAAVTALLAWVAAALGDARQPVRCTRSER